jgi:valyl-tRNA synthetase
LRPSSTAPSPRACSSWSRARRAASRAGTTDTYLELAKLRARDETDAAGRGSAVAGLRLGLSVLLRLFAPFLPFVTEEVWSWAFAGERGEPSIHRAPWPGEADFAPVAAPADAGSFALAGACFAVVNKAKADAAVGAGREIESLTLAANAPTLARVGPVLGDVLAAVRCREHRLEERALADGAFEVAAARFAERAPEP